MEADARAANKLADTTKTTAAKTEELAKATFDEVSARLGAQHHHQHHHHSYKLDASNLSPLLAALLKGRLRSDEDTDEDTDEDAPKVPPPEKDAADASKETSSEKGEEGEPAQCFGFSDSGDDAVGADDGDDDGDDAVGVLESIRGSKADRARHSHHKAGQHAVESGHALKTHKAAHKELEREHAKLIAEGSTASEKERAASKKKLDASKKKLQKLEQRDSLAKEKVRSTRETYRDRRFDEIHKTAQQGRGVLDAGAVPLAPPRELPTAPRT